jgi:hypothetical protein
MKASTPSVTKYTSGRLFGLARKAAEVSISEPGSAVAALVLSTTAFEAFVNDLIDLVSYRWSDEDPWELSAFAFLAEGLDARRAPLDSKLELAFYLFSHRRLERGHQPFQDWQLLFELRNQVVHKRPERAPWPIPGDAPAPNPHGLVQRLADRKIISPPMGADAPFLLQYLEAPLVATWAVETVSRMGLDLLAVMPESAAKSVVCRLFRSILKPDEAPDAIW